MTIDQDLKKAYNLLYEKKDTLSALKLYQSVLDQNNENVIALVYKAAALEKLYYGNPDWHNDQTLENSKAALDFALKFSKIRGKRGLIGLVYFRYFVHYFNDKDYLMADTYMTLCTEFDYKTDTLEMWQTQLTSKLTKLAKKKGITIEELRIQNSTIIEPITNPLSKTDNKTPTPTKTLEVPNPEPLPLPQDKVVPTPTNTAPSTTSNISAPIPSLQIQPSQSKLRTDWYQSQSNVTLSIFTSNLPDSKDDIKWEINAKNKMSLQISYTIPETGSEFQYSIKLAHEIIPDQTNIHLTNKKIELTFKKQDSKKWKTLERDESIDEAAISTSNIGAITTTETKPNISYPSSSKKGIDWSKVNVDDADGDFNEDEGSADAFFQKLYADADPDVKRAMMKSFVESNGTTLNTNWDEVKKGKVETHPPEGMVAKEW
ncbi:hypothetical protein TBLA_0J00950 [Henningerozyma blattae CBS 6284]|uniref:CS domain-containing protein n=1 Tax=Henningerozyma blattae (strain ATCC 34711 / CBS 6284 / DSM 70876 / NBRC 10599 / NRRL Y-10934 / UCD 77-7) TaxID=1071380 RepID=I2H9P1_HENB6|nr:hypothetical protein TBLA_0J00950 [Tetrapisispora blattae CBS 6284]CCH63093.1 hypothetical protein TBLA_0J00950 [Tetrapisispora blattae CBS 6284]